MGIIQQLRKLPNHIYLILGIAIFVFIFPIVDNASVLDIFWPISLTIILLSVFSLIEKKKQQKLIWLGIMVIISISLIWLQYFVNHRIYTYFSYTFNILVFISATVIMVSEIVKSKQVNSKLIMEAISGYLLIGVMFSITNAIIYSIMPDSFRLEGLDRISDIIYFSFITLTTIGYGDISPQTDIARVVSVFFGLSGQLYLTIIMAFIIGKYLNKENK
jgi:voltage-gated potassium channel